MPSVVYPQVEPEKWCEQYGLKIKEHTCAKCGHLQRSTIPWANKKWRGLVAPIHACGPDYQFSTATPSNDKDRNDWKRITEVKNA